LTGYRKISYHLIFDVKYDLRHKERLVEGDNWTVNDEEHFYPGHVRMNTVRIGYFIGELYGIRCLYVTSEMPFHMGTTKSLYNF
jgi:hypothetical protein